jgi:hypothetical protein
LRYDDGDTEWINLTEHDFHLLPVQSEKMNKKEEAGIQKESAADMTSPRQQNLDLHRIQIGSRLDVYWPLGDTYYSATVMAHGPNDPFRVSLLYDDQETEWVDLNKRDFKLLPGDRRSKHRGVGN